MAPSVKKSADSEEGSSEGAERVKDARSVPGGGGRGGEKRGSQWDQRRDAAPSNPS